MIDKLSLHVSHIQGQIPAFLSDHLQSTALEQFQPLGKEGGKYVFVRIPEVAGLHFKCFKPSLYRRGERLSQERIRRLTVSEIDLNPSAYPTFSLFRQSTEPCLCSEIYETGLITARADYAVDRPVTIQAGVQGIYWPNRRRFEDYNLESATTTREYIIGATPHTLAVYDLAAKLARRGEPCPYSPLTRFEMRLSREMVPNTLRRFHSFDQIALHAGEVINGTVRPFEGVELHELRMPQMPERYELPMRTYITRHSAPRIRLEQKQRETWAEIRGMMRFATYPELRRILNVPNGRYQSYWLEMEDTVTILEHFLVENLRNYFDMDEITRLQSSQNRTWRRNP